MDGRNPSLTPYSTMQIPTNSSAPSQTPLLPPTEGRKRHRSLSMESSTSASSRKRSASEDPTASSPVTRSTRLCNTTPPLSDPTSNDIDAYMDSQGESDVLQSTLLSPSHQSNTSQSYSIPQDALSSTLLRFQAIEVMRDMPLIEGSTWALVSKSWWRRFEKAATGQVDKEGGVNEDRVGPVDNSPLLDSEGNLNDDIVEGVDFDCIPEVAWDWLTILYVFVNHQSFLVLPMPPSLGMARQNRVPSEEKSSLVASKESPPLSCARRASATSFLRTNLPIVWSMVTRSFISPPPMFPQQVRFTVILRPSFIVPRNTVSGRSP